MVRCRQKFVCWLLVVTMVVTPCAVSAQQPPAAGAPGVVDLNYITPNAVLAAVAYPRRVLQAPEMEMMPVEIISATSTKELGIEPLDVEQVLLVVEPPAAGPPGAGLVLRFTKPYQLDQLKLPGGMELESTTLNGRPYRQGAGPLGPGLYMPDDRTLIVATDAMLRAMLQNVQSPAAGPLHDLAAKADAGADIAVLAVVPPLRALLNAQLAQAPIPPPFAGVKRLPELVDAIKTEVTMVGQPRSSLVLIAPSDQAAEELEQVIQQLMETGQQMMLGQVTAEMERTEDPVERAAAAYAQRITRRMFDLFRPTRDGNVLVLAQEGLVSNQTAVIGVLVALLLPAVQAAREAARRASSMNNLKQIALAMHIYHDQHRSFPPRASYSSDGKPLLSWRVHLLPYLEQEALYRQFHLDEPWDSPHNRQFIEQMPAVYRNPSARASSSQATYLVPTGKGAIFEGKEGTLMRKITDGTSNTVLVLEVNENAAVVWTKPDDLVFDPTKPLAGLGAAHPGGFLAALADGSVRFISSSIDPQTFLKLLMMADGQPVGDF
jgi:type II secretory pathway pseudopilin PulG